MTKYARAALIGFVLTCAAGAVSAAEPRDLGMLALAENLRFKLARPAPPDTATWAGLVNQTVFIGQRLGVFSDQPVVASRVDGNYVVVVTGRGAVIGADPDQVLGRLLHFLATVDQSGAWAAPGGIADQRLTDTLSYLVSELR